MSTQQRQEYLQKTTKKLVIFTVIILFFFIVFLYGYLKINEAQERSYLLLFVFVFGLLGGFVSLQQRLPKLSQEELELLSSSWISIVLVPLNGGFFALILMLMFAGQIIEGALFPRYPDNFEIHDAASFLQWMKTGYPVNGVDAAKLLFWSFVAGFSERFVPQLIDRTTENVALKSEDQNTPNDKQNTPDKP
jgi:hypothetical protein